MGAVKRVKNVDWEKNRRERFNCTFAELSEQLPNHDPSLTLTKVDILRKTIAYIKDLREKNAQLSDNRCDDAIKSEMASLKTQVTELRQRNQQLAELLRMADISLPPSHPPIMFSAPRKWAGKIVNPPTSLAKDNTERNVSTKKMATKSKSTFKKKTSKRKPESDKETSKATKTTLPPSKIIKTTKKKANVTAAPLREINTTQLNSVGSFPHTVSTMSLVLSNAKSNLMTIADSKVLAAPIMATGLQPVLQRNPTLSTLGPGTLIMSDGRIMPVPSAQPTMQIFVNRPATQPAVILMQNVTAVQPKQKNQVRPIVPKLKPRDSTKTTFVNKVPIPAISTHSAVSSKVASLQNKCAEKAIVKKIKKKVTIKENCNDNPKGKMTQGHDERKSAKSSKPEVSGLNTVRGLDKNKSESNKNDQLSESSINVNGISKTDQTVNSAAETPQMVNVEVIHSQNNAKINSNCKLQNIDRTIVAYDNTPKVPESTKPHLNEIEERGKTNSINTQCPTTNVEVEVPTTKLGSEKASNEESFSNGPNIINRELMGQTIMHNTLTDKNKKENNAATNTNVISSSANIPITTNILPTNTNIISTNINNCTSNTNIIPTNTNILPTNTNIIPTNTSTLPNNTNIMPTNSNLNNTTVSINSSVNGCNQTSRKEMGSNNLHVDVPNKIENVNNLNVQQNKCTQITSKQIICGTESNIIVSENKSENQHKTDVNLNENKSIVSDKKDTSNNSTVQDDTQELTNLFPPDPKLQTCTENIFKDNDFRDRNLFMPITHSYMDEVRLSLPQSDFSNDLFSSLQVPTGGQHPESISPTAAFLLAFPLVSTSKASELIAENETNDSQHATPTTILQIGNIEPPSSELYHQTSLLLENNVTNLQDLSKHCIKSSNSKELKNIDPFNKFQHIEINDLIRNDDFHGKDKKSLTIPPNQDLFATCDKKKLDRRNCNYSLIPDVISNFQQKDLVFPTNNTTQNISQNTTSRQVIPNNSKKNQVHPDNITQPAYVSSSQSYNYNTFPNRSDYVLSHSNYLTPSQSANVSKSQTATNLNTVSWTTTATSTTNHPDYTTNYCNYPNKSCMNQQNKNMHPKVQPNNYEDQRIKEKTQTSNNVLPKFSNFQFNNRPNQDNQNYPHSKLAENNNYKGESKAKKQKTSSQRGPVNWMTTPDIRPPVMDPNSTAMLPDVVFQPQKDLDSILLNTSSGITPFISSSMSNTTQTFYPNSHFSGIDLPLDFAPFPEISGPPKQPRSVPSGQQNPHHYSWSPSKSSIPVLPHIDNQMIPSTLPTLVGDLALGTTTPSGPSDTFRNLSMPITPFNVENPTKKVDIKISSHKSSSTKSPEKESFINTDTRNNNRNVPDYCQKTHSHQSTNTTSSFLSVSQLVDPVKSEQSSSRRNGKQPVINKNNNSSQKRSVSGQQTEKNNQSKVSNIGIAISTNYPMNQRPADVHNGYQDNHGARISYHQNFSQNIVPPPWHNGKAQRGPTQTKGGSYSAESLIGEHLAPPAQEHHSELPPFSIANQLPPNQYNHHQKSFADVPSSYTGEFSHQNIEFHQTHHSHQNCFNFPTQNSHYSSAPFSSENSAEYHLGFDPLYNFNHTLPKNHPSQTGSSSSHKEGRNKRSSSGKRREEFPLNNPAQSHYSQAQTMQFLQTPQVYPPTSRAKCLPTCPSSSSSTLTNFNLSTIFPEINDKRAVQGSNSFHPSSSGKASDSSTIRSTHGPQPDYFNSSLAPQMQQVGISAPHFPPVSFANLPPPSANFRPQ